MNNEYIILSDGNVAIANEKGKIAKRKLDENGDLNEILMCENKIEMIDDAINVLNKGLEDQKRLISFCKIWPKIQLILIAIITILCFVIGGISSAGDFVVNGIYDGLFGLLYSSIIVIAPLLIVKFKKSKSEKKAIGLEGAIEKASKLKELYEKKLSKIKQKRITKSTTDYSINNPISLVKQNEEAHSQIEKELNSAYEKAIDDKPKKFVLNTKKANRN